MLQGEHSAILSTFIKLPYFIKILVLPFLSGCLRHDLLYCITYTYYHVLSVLGSLLTRCKLNILIKVRFFTTKKNGSTGPTALESDGLYFNHGTMTRAHYKTEGLIPYTLILKIHIYHKHIPSLLYYSRLGIKENSPF